MALVAVVLAVVAGSAVSACGVGSASGQAAGSVVKPPDVTLQGCTYEVDGKVPAGEPPGIQPPFASFSPDPAATAALGQIERHGGTGLVDGFPIPSGTKLYAGPDSSSTPVGTVPEGHSLLVSDPVLWTTSSRQRWLATFLACGGPSPYWIDIAQIAEVNHNAGLEVSTVVAQLVASPPFTRSGRASALPITVGADGHLAWAAHQVPFVVGRGEYLGY